MSIKKVFIKLCLTLTGVIAVAYSIHQTTEESEGFPQNGRRLASVGKKGYLAMGKANRVMDIRIEEVPVDGFSGTRLAATVSVHKEIETSIQMQWELPPGVNVVSGEKDYWIHSLLPGQTHYAELDVTNFRGEGSTRESEDSIKQVRLSGTVQIAGAPIGADAVFSSHVMQRDLSYRQRAPASMQGILRRKTASHAGPLSEEISDVSGKPLEVQMQNQKGNGEVPLERLPKIHF